LLAGPVFDALLPKEESRAYQVVAESMKGLNISSMSIADIKLLSSQSPLIRAISVMISTPPAALMRAHFVDNYINGIFLKEMFVLRSAVSSTAPSA
jgi:hypothetical protein